MYEEVVRPPNSRERAVLETRAAKGGPSVTLMGTVRPVLMWCGGLLLCGLLVAVMFLLAVPPMLGGLLGGPIALAAIFFSYAAIGDIRWYFCRRKGDREFRRRDLPEIRSVLEGGNVFAKKVSAAAVIEITPFEDEGSGYLYDVGDGRTMLLKGQRFEFPEEDTAWPNTDFEIVYTEPGRMWIGIFCSGEELPPISEIATTECPEEVAWAEYEEIRMGSLEAVAKSLRK